MISASTQGADAPVAAQAVPTAVIVDRTTAAAAIYSQPPEERERLRAAMAEGAFEPSPEFIVKMRPGADVYAFAAQRGLVVKYTFRSDPTMHVLLASSNIVMAAQVDTLLEAMPPEVLETYPNPPTRAQFAFSPNDPYFLPISSPVSFPGQWHLRNATPGGLDVNISGAWNRELTGEGVVIGIVDDGVETGHPDLASNFTPAESHDFGGDDPDPTHTATDLGHGTAVAGVAAALGGNNRGVTGAAPHGQIAGLRIEFSRGDAPFADATQYRSIGASRTIRIKNHSYGFKDGFWPQVSERKALLDSADTLRNGGTPGTIHIIAAGNDRRNRLLRTTSGYLIGESPDANKKGIQSHPDVITVSAIGSTGRIAIYSNFGANVFVTAPSHGYNVGDFGITTTDRSDSGGFNTDTKDPFPDAQYTSLFDGTSAAAPLVAGIMALGVQANPNMDVRMAKHLLARTSRVVHADDTSVESDGGWKTNAAGFRFNQNYGYGLIDADAFTAQAVQFSGVTPLTIAMLPEVTPNVAVPDNGNIAVTFNVEATEPLEVVEVHLRITHPWRGDLEAYLTSPRGTTRRLFRRDAIDGNLTGNRTGIDWSFTSNAFWGELPNGQWTIRVHDTAAGFTGTLNSYRANLRMGSLIPIGGAVPPTITSFTPGSGPVGTSVAITGTKFVNVEQVRFNGANATYTVDSPTQITATVPANATSGPITVTATGGTATSSTSFTVTTAPAITGFTPASGAAGTIVAISGANFTNVSSVRFGSVPATFTLVSATMLNATVPAGATSGRITVTTPSGTGTSTTSFEVTPTPGITDFTPVAGFAGTLVTIRGSNFSGATAVRFNGATSSSVTINTAAQITATVPAGATTGPISVITPGGTATSSSSFQLLSAPQVTNVIPNSGPVGRSVVITGQGFEGATAVAFNNTPATFTVNSASQITATVPAGATSGPVQVTNPAGSANSPTVFTVIVPPPNDAFAASVLLSGASGRATGSNVGASREMGEPVHPDNVGGKSIWFHWTAPASGIWVVDMIGSSFDTLLAVYTGSTVSTLSVPIASNDNLAGGVEQSEVRFAANAGMIYRVLVDGFNSSVSDPNGALDGIVVVNWRQAALTPTITSFSPTSGTAGTLVTLTGAGFDGANAVTFDGVAAASFTVVSETRIDATAPIGVTSGPLAVTTAVGTATSGTSFTALSAPANDNFAAAQIPPASGGEITGSTRAATRELGEPLIVGNNGGHSVWFAWTAPSSGRWTISTTGSSFDTLLGVYTGNTVNALTLVDANDDAIGAAATHTSLVRFDAVAGTTYRIAIDGYVGESGAYRLTWAFTPLAPAITGFQPSGGPVGSTVTITGSNFTGTTAVTFGTLVATFTVNSATSLAATVPAGALTARITVTNAGGSAVTATSFQVVDAPPNDAFADAELIAGTRVFAWRKTTNSGREIGEPHHGGNTGGHSIWYRWIAPASGRWVVDLSGSSYDTLVGIYTGSAVGSLVTVGGDDDDGIGLASRAAFAAAQGTTYWIAVDGYGGASGWATLRILPEAALTTLYSTGFEAAEGFMEAPPLAGQQGWTKAGTGGDGILDGLFPNRGQQAYVGLFPPTGTDELTYLWRPLNHPVDLATGAVMRFTTSMAILDSDNGHYDDFMWQVYSPSARLFSLRFDNSNLKIFYKLQGGDTVPYIDTGAKFENNYIHSLSLVLDFAGNTWSAFLDGVTVVDRRSITSSVGPLTIADIDAVWALPEPVTPGDNYMAFDDFSVSLESSPAPVITMQPESRSTVAGGTVAFAVAAAGSEPFSYQWFHDGVALSGANQPVLLLESAQAGDSGSYVCRVSNFAGEALSADATLVVDGPPGVAAHPTSQTIAAGNNVTLSVSATGPGPFTYQWRYNGRDIAGATQSTHRIDSLQRFNAGTYTVVVTNQYGSTATHAAVVNATPPPASNSRLLNLSTRGLSQTDANVLIPGFVVQGTGSRRLLIRTVGPTLAVPPISFPGAVVPDPRMQLKRLNVATQQYEDIAANDDWQTNANVAAIATTTAQLSAFELKEPRDAALLVDVSPGQYTVVTGDRTGVSGIAIVELYDADSTGTGSQLINLSNRGYAGVGDQVMIPGFVISHEGSKTLLMRVVGPTLADFGVGGTMTDPRIELFPGGASAPILTNDNWSDNPDAAYTAQIAQQVFAFPLNAGSKDAAFVVTLQPGSYTVVGSSAGGAGTGVVLVEVYVVP